MNEYFITVQVYIGDMSKYHMLNVYVEMSRLTIDNLNAFRKDIAKRYDVPWENATIINIVKLDRRSPKKQVEMGKPRTVNGPL